MTLSDTVDLMLSDDPVDQLKAEYLQAYIRDERLKSQMKSLGFSLDKTSLYFMLLLEERALEGYKNSLKQHLFYYGIEWMELERQIVGLFEEAEK